jgi:hypothetical protein
MVAETLQDHAQSVPGAEPPAKDGLKRASACRILKTLAD